MLKKKKRKLNSKGKLVLFLFSLIVLGVILGSSQYFIRLESDTNASFIEDDDSSGLEKKEEKKKSISLVMVGDNLIHDKIYNEARIGDSYDFSKMYSLVKPIIQRYDLAYYNQETILGGSEIGLSSYPAFNSPYEVGNAMVDVGFNLVSLATNHTLDRGEKAVVNSRNYWNRQEGVLAVGSYSSMEEKEHIIIKEKNGITYALLNYTYGTNGIKVPYGKEYLVNIWPVNGSNPEHDSAYQSYKQQVEKDIDALKKVDLLMVAMHWGVEYQYQPNAYQKDMAQYLSSLGVDIIIGTHPHVIQPIEWIGDTLVIYSLGNFLSAHEVIDLGNRIGLMSSIEVVKEVNDVGDVHIKLQNLRNELLYTYYTNQYHDFLIVPFSQMKEEYLNQYLTVYERYKDIVQGFDKNIFVESVN